jgi:hypothetical protein
VTTETFDERVKRAKARWLKRVMYQSEATPFQKSLAYAIADHLNCVTLDCWPAQLTLCRLLGGVCTKTLQRASSGLAALGLITISRGAGIRYAPVFQLGDEDKPVQKGGQISPNVEDTDVRESFLEIHLTSDSTAAVPASGRRGSAEGRKYRRSERGKVEIELAKFLGSDGFEILARLSSINDAIVERLCRAFACGQLGDRELMAARLAAEQVRSR